MTDPDAVEGGKLHEGVWLPADEEHLVGMMSPGAKRFARLPDGRAAYQLHKYLAMLELVPAGRRKVFVDVGAHVGLWSMAAAFDFEEIVAFEPQELHQRLFVANLTRTAVPCRVSLKPCALGDHHDGISLAGRTGSSGDTHVAGTGGIPMRRLDDFGLTRADLIKIDTEGYELPICRGAVETLKRCRPFVVLEQKGRDALYHGGGRHEALAFLKQLGMVELRQPISGDHFLGFPD